MKPNVFYVPMSATSRVGYHLAKGDRLLPWSGAISIKSPAIGWLVDIPTKWCKGTTQGQLKEFAVTSYLALLLFFQKNYLK